MEINNIKELVKNSLIYYYENNTKYYKYIKFNDITIDNDNDKIILDNNSFDYEVLGIFNKTNKIWIWSWSIYDIKSNLIQLSKELLNYGLKLEIINNDITLIHLLLKSLFVNSRININTIVELINIIAIISYLFKNKHKFIYTHHLKDTNYAIYYLVK